MCICVHVCAHSIHTRLKLDSFLGTTLKPFEYLSKMFVFSPDCLSVVKMSRWETLGESCFNHGVIELSSVPLLFSTMGNQL